MTTADPAASQRSLNQDMWHAVRYYLGTRTGMVLSAVALLGAGAYFNWGWLVALGLAPIIIGALPCAAMRALGLCIGGHTRPAANISEAGENVAGGKSDRHGCCGPTTSVHDDGKSIRTN